MALQAIITEERGEGAAESNIKVAKSLIFNKEIRCVRGFITAYILYLRIRIRKAIVGKQI